MLWGTIEPAGWAAIGTASGVLVAALAAAGVKVFQAIRSQRTTDRAASFKLGQEERAGVAGEWKAYALAREKLHAEDIRRLDAKDAAQQLQINASLERERMCQVEVAKLTERLGYVQTELNSMKRLLDREGIRPRGDSDPEPFKIEPKTPPPSPKP